MRKTYISTFVSGLQGPVTALLEQNLSDVTIKQVLDGLVVYQSGAGDDAIKKLRFFNNSFIMIKRFDKLRGEGRAALDFMLGQTAESRGVEQQMRNVCPPLKGNFRIITSIENQPGAVNRELLKKVERKVAGGMRLRLNLQGAQHEFWLLSRSERVGFFMLRISRNKDAKDLHRGELRRELAHILCALSEPAANDIFLDPFSGYGSIPLERAKAFPANLIFANDKKPEMKNYLKERLETKKLKKLIIPKTLDAFELPPFEDGFIDKIVTDPPWGLYNDLGMDIVSFYRGMMIELYRILKPGGIMVILSACKEELSAVLNRYRAKLKVAATYDILVSGKKATVYKIVKAG